MSNLFINQLKTVALQCRRNVVTQIFNARSGHPGGSLSCIDILVYLFKYANIGSPNTESHLILSKGHAAPALYAVAAEFGLIPHLELLSFRKINGLLQGHPHVQTTPWVNTSTGSLGQGFSVSVGMALGFKHQIKMDRVYAILGDGEMQEGEVWEAAMSAAHFNLDNLCVVVDYNKLQSDNLNENIMSLESLRDKWSAFNWNVIEIDGHDFENIEMAFNSAVSNPRKPTVIIANTIKGKGISYMESVPTWHGSVTMRNQELEQALRDLNTPETDIPKYLDGSIWSDTK